MLFKLFAPNNGYSSLEKNEECKKDIFFEETKDSSMKEESFISF